ncbi:MAG: hypothetical protein ACRCSG_07225 [Cellulosilyticaceae bacterium]
MRFFITDLKRGFTERNFVNALIIASVCLIISMYANQNLMADGNNFLLATQSLILPFIAPLLAAFPYANMIMIEQDTKYEQFMWTKNNQKSYAISRWFTTGIIGGGVLAIPISCVGVITYFISSVFSWQTYINVIGISFIFGFVYAGLSYGLTFVNTKTYLPVIAPQVIYLLFIYAFPYIGLEAFYPPLSFSPWIIKGVATPGQIIMQYVVVGITGIALVIGGVIWKRVMDLKK